VKLGKWKKTILYEDVILLTLQLLYYRSWVSEKKKTHT
jgi:hypothetical protein